MITIIRRRERKTQVAYSLVWSYKSNPSTSFSFDCDEHGNVSADQANHESLKQCRAGKAWDGEELIGPFVERREWTYSQLAVGRCSCGREVELSHPLDNECECGKCYNMCGQSVVPSWCCDDQGNPTHDEDDLPYD